MSQALSSAVSPWAIGTPTAKGKNHSPWLIAFVIALPPFMEVLDVTIAAVALPQIAGGLGASIEDATSVLTWYLVANATVLPLTGWLATTIGRKRFYLGCIASFTAASLLCGLATTLPMLVAFRIVQGMTGAGLQTLSQAILADTFPPAKRGEGFAAFSLAVVLAPALGPTIGGWLTDHFSWHWLFLINIPVGLFTLFVVWAMIKDPPWEEEYRRKALEHGLKIDYVGIGLVAIGLSSLVYFLEKGQDDNWFASNVIFTCAILAGTALPALVIWEVTRKNPVVDLRLLKERGFAASNVLILVFALFVVGSTQILPEFAQGLLGYTATQAGLALTFGGLILVVLMPLLGQLVQRVHPRYLIGFGLLMEAGSFCFLFSNWNTDLSFWSLTIDRMIQMAGVPFIAVPLFTAAYTGLPAGKNNNAAALLNMNRALGGSIGIALLQTMLQRQSQIHQNDLVSHVTPYNKQFQQMFGTLHHTFSNMGAGPKQAVTRSYAMIYHQVQAQAQMLAYLDMFVMIGLAALCAVPLVLLLRRMDT